MGRGKAPAFYHRERKVLGHSLVEASMPAALAQEASMTAAEAQ